MEIEPNEENSENEPASTDATSSTEDEYTQRMLRETTEKMVRDMKFVSIFTIVGGVLYCLSFFGAIFGIPMIIAGIRLRDGARWFVTYQEQRDDFSLEKAFRYQQKFFFIGKILIIITLVLFVLYIAAMIFFFTHFMDGLDMMREFEGHTV